MSKHNGRASIREHVRQKFIPAEPKPTTITIREDVYENVLNVSCALGHVRCTEQQLINALKALGYDVG